MQSGTESDYYSILGVNPQASTKDIKRAFRKLAFDTHPDRHPDDTLAAKKFIRLETAYECLSNERLRAEYDGQCRTRRNLEDVVNMQAPQRPSGFEKRIDEKHFSDLWKRTQALRYGGLALIGMSTFDLINAYLSLPPEAAESGKIAYVTQNPLNYFSGAIFIVGLLATIKSSIERLELIKTRFQNDSYKSKGGKP